MQILVAVGLVTGLAAVALVLWKSSRPFGFLVFQLCCAAPLAWLLLVPPQQGQGGMLAASLLVPILAGVWWVVSIWRAMAELAR